MTLRTTGINLPLLNIRVNKGKELKKETTICMLFQVTNASQEKQNATRLQTMPSKLFIAIQTMPQGRLIHPTNRSAMNWQILQAGAVGSARVKTSGRGG